MEIIIFTIGAAIYLAALRMLIKGHKALNLRFGWPGPIGLANNAISYFFFAVFICVIIPFALFFHYGSTHLCPYFSQLKQAESF